MSNYRLAECLNSLECESASRRFQPGGGPSRGLFCDCETDGSLAALIARLLCLGRLVQTALPRHGHRSVGGTGGQAAAAQTPNREILNNTPLFISNSYNFKQYNSLYF